MRGETGTSSLGRRSAGLTPKVARDDDGEEVQERRRVLQNESDGLLDSGLEGFFLVSRLEAESSFPLLLGLLRGCLILLLVRFGLPRFEPVQLAFQCDVLQAQLGEEPLGFLVGVHGGAQRRERPTKPAAKGASF